MRGQFQNPVPGTGAVSCHITTLLLGIFILDTTAPHIRKYVTRVLWERAQRHAHPLSLRSWQLGFVMASAAIWWIGRSRARYALDSTFTGFPLCSGTCSAAHRTLAASKAKAGRAASSRLRGESHRTGSKALEFRVGEEKLRCRMKYRRSMYLLLFLNEYLN